MRAVLRDKVALVLVGVFVAARLVATIGAPVRVHPDTPAFFHVGFWGHTRFPVVTIIYSVVGDHRAIVTIQSVVGVAAWATMALVLASLVAQGAPRVVLLVAVLALGLTPAVTGWDVALLSESLATSLMVLFFACTVAVAVRPSQVMVVVAVAAGVGWLLTRPASAVVGIFAVGAIAVAAWFEGRSRRLLLVAGLVFVVVVPTVAMAASNVGLQQSNTLQVIHTRILGHPDRVAWFARRGMPTAAEGAADPDAWATRAPSLDALPDDAAFMHWLETDGVSAYRSFLVSHPGYVLLAPLTDAQVRRGMIRAPFDYGDPRVVTPGPVVRLYWPQGTASVTVVGLVALAVAGAVVVALVRLRRVPSGVPTAGAFIVFSGITVFVTAHTAGYEYSRLMFPAAVVARLAFVWIAVRTWDAWRARAADVVAASPEPATR